MSTTPTIRSAMYPRNLFVRSAYWGTWSRVLQYMNRAPTGSGRMMIDQVEVNLTTPNVRVESEWRKNERIWIRCHGTTADPKDIYTADLPGHVLDLMREYLTSPTIHLLLHADLLPMIDWDKYRSVCNGGAPLDLIFRTPPADEWVEEDPC